MNRHLRDRAMRTLLFMLVAFVMGTSPGYSNQRGKATFKDLVKVEKDVTPLASVQKNARHKKGRVEQFQTSRNAFNLKKFAAVADLSAYLGQKTIIAHRSDDGQLRLDTLTIEKISDTKLRLKNFLFENATVEADVNLSSNQITIAPQHVFDVEEGPIWLCSYDPHKGVYSTEDPIVGVLDGGNIHFQTGFGFYATEGSYTGANLAIGLMSYADVVTPNANMNNKVVTFKDNTMNVDNRVVTEATDWAYVYQVADNLVRVTHIPVGGIYGDLLVKINYDGSLSIDPQPLVSYNYSEYSFYMMTEEVDQWDDITLSTSILDPLPAVYDKSKNTLSWGEWIAASVSRSSYLAIVESSSLALNGVSITIPQQPSANFEGKGTEADPYIISSLEQLHALSISSISDKSVRSAKVVYTESDGTQSYYYPVYKDKYFKLTSDLDYDTYKSRISTIGNDSCRFAGVFDGGGHKLSNFKIEDYAYDYCGLFGVVDTSGAVKNLTFESPYISSMGYNIGFVAGANHGAIEGIKITDGIIDSPDGYYVGGLSGNSPGSIKNSSFSGKIDAKGNIGGIAGVSAADIIDCTVVADISMDGKQTFVGGIVGLLNGLQAKSTPTVSGCSYAGTIDAYTSEVGVGGLIGMGLSLNLSKSFAVAALNGTSNTLNYFGGLIGTVYRCKVNDSYSAGSIKNPNTPYAGGLVGHSSESEEGAGSGSTFTDCYTSVSVKSDSEEAARALTGDTNFITLDNCYFDAQVMPVTYEGGLKTSELAAGTAMKNFDSATWSFTAGAYPRLKGMDTSDIAIVSAAAVIMNDADNSSLVTKDFSYSTNLGTKWASVQGKSTSEAGGYAFSFANGVGKLNGEIRSDTIVVSKSAIGKQLVVNIAPISFEGEGTAASPWLISKKADLEELSKVTNLAHYNFDGKYLKMTADIDMQSAALTPICKDDAGIFMFQGSFDGDGHTIDNLIVQTIEFFGEGSEKPGVVNPQGKNSYYNGGLFGILGKRAVVKNVTIGASSKYDLFYRGGAIAGLSYGVIDGCKNYATIKSYFATAGGIVGELQGSAVVRNSFNAGSVYAGLYGAGGIAGTLNAGTTVENSINAGEVAAKYLNPYMAEGSQYIAGGIVGENKGGKISNVVNSGSVSSYKQVGGIAGTQQGGSVESGVNYGLLKSFSDRLTIGAIIGDFKSGGVENSYFDNQLNKVGAVSNSANKNVASLRTVELAAGNLELDKKLWSQTNGSYPTLTAFSDLEEVKLASKATILFAESDNINYVHNATKLGNTSVVGWDLKKKTDFTIADGTLNVTIPKQGTVQDTIIASLGASKRFIPIQSYNANVLAGEGTEKSPFLIASSADFMTLSNFVKETGHDYDGAYFKVTGNLDFKDVEFVPLASGTGVFQGNLDGNNKVVSNITYDTSKSSAVDNSGFIGTLGLNGVLANLTLDETNSIKGANRAGGFVGSLHGIVKNCTNKAAVESTGSYAGGIAGYLYSATSITESKNYGAVKADRYGGGIFGASADGAESTVSTCDNEGVIEAEYYAGGIAGQASASFADCSNKGKVTATEEYAAGIVAEALYPSSIRNSVNEAVITSEEHVAGIVSLSDDHSDKNQFVIDNCSNKADINYAITKSAFGEVGGIGGELGAGTVISNCFNLGNLQSEVTSVRWTGGIVGEMTGEEGAKSQILNCYNEGNVTGLNSVGGIAGKFDGNGGYAIVENSYNLGNVTSTHARLSYVGGLVGNSGGYDLIDSWNAGTVSGYGEGIGGLSGYISGQANKFERCFNVGDVKVLEVEENGTKAVSDEGENVGGLIGNGRPVMTYCYNFGEVLGYKNVGGLIGLPASYSNNPLNKVVIRNSYNAGKVVLAEGGSNSGSIYAVNSSNAKYPEALSIASTYYDSSINSPSEAEKLQEGIKGLTTREMLTLDLGGSFDNQTATYPSLKNQAENAVNNFYVASVLLAEGDSFDNVTADFVVGTPEGVEWTATGNVSIEGGKVSVNNVKKGEKATLTITAGELQRTYELVLNKDKESGVESVKGSREVVGVSYYDLNGREVEKVENASEMLIEKTTFDDGTTSIRKLVPAKK